VGEHRAHLGMLPTVLPCHEQLHQARGQDSSNSGDPVSIAWGNGVRITYNNGLGAVLTTDRWLQS